MGKLGGVYRKLARPQLVVGVLVVAGVVSGYVMLLATPSPTSAPAEIVKLAKPLAHHVQSASITVPVDCAKVPCIALTFDDGPSAGITPQVLDALDRHHARATFFLIGLHVGGNEALVRRMHLSGHEIGNHTWDHPDLTTLSPQDIENQIAKTQAAIAGAGVPLPRLLRPPYGGVNAMVRGHVPLTIVLWNVDPEDWKPEAKPEKIVEHVLANARPGKVIILHDIRQVTADALEPILAGLEQNYHLVTISELLDLPAGQPGIFYGR